MIGAQYLSSDLLRIGVVGLGAAARAFFKSFEDHPGLAWVAFAESNANVRQTFEMEQAAWGLKAFNDLESMLQALPELDVVYIATPTDMHKNQTLLALQHGKHVLVEKPMAVDLQEAHEMVLQAKRCGRQLLVGHSHSYDLPIHAMRKIIETGELGQVKMAHTWCYTDWMYRPRRAEELDERRGGGVTYRQGAHQFDVLRLLCGGLAKSVRAKTFDLDADRSGIGAHTVFIDFEGTAGQSPCATAVYNGYAGLSSMDLTFDISEWGFHQPRMNRSWHTKASLSGTAQDELKAKQLRAKTAIPKHSEHQPFFGLTLLSCEFGDVRQSPNGLIIDSRWGQEERELSLNQSTRDMVLQELHGVLKLGEKPIHSGAWGLANLEICQASIQSALERREIELHHQVSV